VQYYDHDGSSQHIRNLEVPLPDSATILFVSAAQFDRFAAGV
jgi:hypothetical protein